MQIIFFIESAFSSIIFNTNGRTSTSTPNMIVHSSGKVGIGNDNPQSMLHIGNSDVVGSTPVLLFGKNNGSGSRNAFMGYADSFFFVFGDYGSSNGTNTLTQQFAINYTAPTLSILVNTSGYVLMQYSYGSTSDERIKTILNY